MRPNRTSILLAVPALLLLAAAIPAVALQAGTPTIKKSAMVRIDGQNELKAPTAQVWTALTSARGLAALTGFKLEGAKGLAKVGEVVSAGIWSDKGNLVCTHVVDGKELRISFEPENASYICETRVVLEPLAGGPTKLTITDRYSDDNTDTVDKTAKEAAAEMTRHMAAFQVLAEKP